MRLRSLLLALVALAMTGGVTYIDKPPVVEIGTGYSRIGAGPITPTPTIRHVGNTVDVDWVLAFGSACSGLSFDSTTSETPTVTTDGTTGWCGYFLETTDVASRWRQDPVSINVYGECNDGIDNDGNGLIDFPADPGCESIFDATEASAPPPEPETDCVSTSGITSGTPGLLALDISTISETGVPIIGVVTCGENINVASTNATWDGYVGSANGNSTEGTVGGRIFYLVPEADEDVVYSECSGTGRQLSVIACKFPGVAVPINHAGNVSGHSSSATWTPASLSLDVPSVLIRTANMNETGGALDGMPFGAGIAPVYAPDGSGAAIDFKLVGAGESDNSAFTFESPGRSGVHLAAMFALAPDGDPTPDPFLELQPRTVFVESASSADAATIQLEVLNIGQEGSVIPSWTASVTASPNNCGGGSGAGWIQGSATGEALDWSGTPPEGDLFDVAFVGSGSGCTNGTYEAEVCVVASGVAGSPSCSTITLERTGNVPPSVDAGPNQTIPGGGLVQLNGTVVDTDDTPTLAWTLSGGCSGLSSATIANPTFTISSSAQTCTAELCADDGTNAPVCDSMTINVPAGGDTGFACSSIEDPSGTITFQLNGSYTCGRFVDGQPWVVENSPGSGVVVSQMTPTYTTGRNGWEINPVGEGQVGPGATMWGTLCNASNPCDFQAADSRVTSGRIRWYNPNIRHPLPLTVSVGGSLIKYDSREIDNCANSSQPRTCIDQAAVLTVLASAPPAGSFRPPYPGTSKPIFSASSINLSTKLPSTALPNTDTNQITLAQALGVFGAKGVWGLDVDSYAADRLMARLNIARPTGQQTTYGCDVGGALNAAMIRTAQSGTTAQKQELVYRLVQLGIDAYYATQTEHGKSWDNRGGCVTPGFKTLILYAGHMLDGQVGVPEDMTGSTYSAGSDEDANHYQDPNTGNYLWGYRFNTSCTTATSISCSGGSEATRSCDGLRDAGACAFGSGCSGCSGGSAARQVTLAAQESGSVCSQAPYQTMLHHRLGSATVARIFGFETRWNYPPFFAVMDRMGDGPCNASSSSHGDDFLKAAWKKLGCSTGTCETNRTWP